MSTTVARAPVARSDEEEQARRPEPVAQPEAQASSPAPRRGSASKGFTILALVLAVVLGAIGIYAFVTRNQESTDDAFVDADVVAVAPRVGGQVAEVEARDNSHVKAGQVLVVLDKSDLEAELAQAQAGLASARAALASAQAQERITEAAAKGGFRSAKAVVSGSSVGVQAAAAQVAVAKAAVDRAQADAHQTEVDLGRARQLFASGAVSQQQLDHGQAGYDAAQAALAQAQAQLSAAQEARTAAQSQVAQAQGQLAQSAPVDAKLAAAHAATELATAQVQQAESTLTLAQLRLSYATIRAPAEGRVSDLNARVGRQLTAGQPIAQLVPDVTYVTANFKETQIGDMRPGNRAVIDVDAYPGKHFEGVVESLSGGTGARFSLLPPDNASGNFVKVVQRVPVQVRWLKPPKIPMRAGLSTVVTVHTDQRVFSGEQSGND